LQSNTAEHTDDTDQRAFEKGGEMTPVTHAPDQRGETIVLPQYVGSWQMGGSYGLRISVTKKPRWLTRKVAAWLLEWEWKGKA